MNYNEYVKSFPQAKEVTEKEFERFEQFKLGYTGKIQREGGGDIICMQDSALAFYQWIKLGYGIFFDGVIESRIDANNMVGRVL